MAVRERHGGALAGNPVAPADRTPATGVFVAPFRADEGRTAPVTSAEEGRTAPVADTFGGRGREQGLAFARRIYLPRTLGLALGFLAVAAVLYQNGAQPLAWTALALNGFVWPHVAYAIARRSRDPFRAELRNLVADSGAGGVWVALMGFNLLPSALLVAMLSMDKIAAGGARLFVRAAAVQVACCAAAVLAFGLDFRPDTTLLSILACLPLLMAYPIAVGVTTYRLSRRIREQNRLLSALSRTDGLSRLLNRTSWEQVVSSELARHRRNARPAALLMLDVDHFKQINDRYGHPAGDEVIRNIAAIVTRSVREADTAGRYGGDEFGVVLPDTGIVGARGIAERIRRRIEAATVETKSRIRCTISIGVAELLPEIADPRQWIDRADRALYRAKELGRNRTVLDGTSGT
jgi:diguanylate cyclase